MIINGKKYRPFVSAFNNEEYASQIVGRRGSSPIPHRRSKLTNLDAVVEILEEGDVISYPHYYRTGDRGLEKVVAILRKHSKRNIILYGNAIFDHTDPWLLQACKDGVIGGIYGNIYKKFGNHVMQGELLPWVTNGFSHGNRVRKLQTGEVHVKVAFGPVPIADIHGNANGVMGKEEQWCGPLGLFAADAEFADYVCLLAGTVSNDLILPAAIPMEQVDFVVHLDPPGLSSGIGSGTLDVGKAKSNPFNALVAENVTKVMKASSVVKDNFNFQVGSGAGLIVLENIRAMLKEAQIQANFAIGGATTLHIEMLEEETIRYLLHGQLFEPSSRVVKSLLTHPRHFEFTAGCYASVATKEAAVNMLDLAVLTALEVDLEFNVNTVCANGRIVGGIGGGQDVAAGADLTVMFLPLAAGKEGKGFPKVVEKVYTRTTPGEVVDVVVTEEYVCINPQSKSTYRDTIKENAKQYGLNLVSIDELHNKSVTKAQEFGTLPPLTETTDEVVHAIEWRDGTLLDVIKKVL